MANKARARWIPPKPGWNFSTDEIFACRLFISVLVAIAAMCAWSRWRPHLTGVFPVKKSTFIDAHNVTLPKTGGGSKGQGMVDVGFTMPAHYAVTVEIDGQAIKVWLDEDKASYLADGKLTIDYLRGSNGIEIMSVRD